MVNRIPSFIPATPDQEIRYPLSGNAEIVITTYESSTRSSPVDITIQGLTHEQINNLVESLIKGEDHDPISGDDDDIATCLAIAEGGLSSPRPRMDSKPIRAAKSPGQAKQQSTSNDGSSNGSSGRTRTRITEDELSDAIAALVAVEPNGMAKSDILAQAEVEERLWIPAMKTLLDQEIWKVEGVKRGARYYAI